jgi:hypothetical protein
MQDISEIIKSAGIGLEAQAFKAFGAAVQGDADRSLGSIFSNRGQSDALNSSLQNDNGVTADQAASLASPGIWDSTRYAAQNASRAMGSISNAPKIKFLFKISFSFFPEMIEYASSLNGTDLSALMRSLDFSVKQIDLPTVELDYEEVNMYNFRTKVLKQIRHKEISLTFYDDIGNKALDFMNIYRMLLIPAARREQDSNAQLNEYGFTFLNEPTSLNTSFRSPLPGDKKDILSQIIIHQYYVEMGSPDPVKVNEFVFTNPKITSISDGDQDHENGGTPNTITCSFDFDTLYLQTGQSALNSSRPPKAVMTYDILSDYSVGGTVLYGGQQVSPGGVKNSFINTFIHQNQQIFQTSNTNPIRRTMGNMQFGGTLSNSIISDSGALGEAANRTLSSISYGMTQGLALPSVAPLNDNSVPSSQVVNLTRQTRSNDIDYFID